MLNERTIATIRELFEAEIDLAANAIKLDMERYPDDKDDIDHWTERLNSALSAKKDFEDTFGKMN